MPKGNAKLPAALHPRRCRSCGKYVLPAERCCGRRSPRSGYRESQADLASPEREARLAVLMERAALGLPLFG